jgi:hypothetical protein
MRFAVVVASIFVLVLAAAVWVLRPSAVVPAAVGSTAGSILAARQPIPAVERVVVSSEASDITAGGPVPPRTAPEQHSSLDDVHYIPPIGSRQYLDIVGDEKSIWLSRLEKLISAKVGRVVSVPRAWAFKEKDGDTTVCGAYMGTSEPIIFIYNTGGVKGAAPALYLNVDRQTYSSFGCDQDSATPLIGA